MTEIVELHKKTYIWVCECGCTSFELEDTGAARCALCAEPRESQPEDGGWHRTDNDPDWDADRLSPIRQVGANGDPDFVRALTVKRAQQEDVVAVVVLREGGSVHVWCNIETTEQHEWAKRRMVESFPLMAPRGVPDGA